MKKLFTLIAVVCFVQLSFGQSSLPNGNFEEWNYNATHGYYEPGGGFFYTLNILDTIPTPAGISVYPVTDLDSVYSGTKAARLITRNIDLLQVIIPGVVGTIEIQWLAMNAKLGTKYIWDTKAARFQGHYMSYPINGDSTAAILLLSKWNSSAGKRDTIAYNRLMFHGEVNTYTKFDVDIDYWDTSTMPDSITVLLLSCGGFNALNMMGAVGQLGTQAYFDDVTLTNIAGLEFILMPEVDVKLAPNPASHRMAITLSEQVKNGVFEVYNAQGKLMQSSTLNGITTTIDVSRLINGAYYYKVTDGSSGLNSGQFIISK